VKSLPPGRSNYREALDLLRKRLNPTPLALAVPAGKPRLTAHALTPFSAGQDHHRLTNNSDQ
jgi:hypothetical protein